VNIFAELADNKPCVAEVALYLAGDILQFI